MGRKQKDKKRRLFIDPASISSGWALFEGTKFIKSGTVKVKEKNQFQRLRQVNRHYWDVAIELPLLHEVHIEQFGGRPSHILHWSVGVIGTALSHASPYVAQDVPVSSWQKAMDWNGERAPLKKFKVESEDELAAIGMGLFWIGRLKNE